MLEAKIVKSPLTSAVQAFSIPVTDGHRQRRGGLVMAIVRYSTTPRLHAAAAAVAAVVAAAPAGYT